MISLKNRQSGFTIVGLLIVIVVIGILAGLVVTTFNGIQQKGRDTERQTDIKALHSQLEAYYAKTGTYPLLSQFNDSAFRAANMQGLDSDALQDPRGTTPVLVAAPVANSYSFQVYEVDGTTACTVAANCAKYILTATLEGQINGASTYVKDSLN